MGSVQTAGQTAHKTSKRVLKTQLGRVLRGTCVLCGSPLPGHGHNPAPLASAGRACTPCNDTNVLPARLAGVR